MNQTTPADRAEPNPASTPAANQNMPVNPPASPHSPPPTYAERVLRLAYYALWVAGALLVIGTVRGVFTTLLVSLLLAYLLDPAVDRLQARSLSRNQSIGLVALALAFMCLALGFGLLPPLVGEAQLFSSRIGGWLSSDAIQWAQSVAIGLGLPEQDVAEIASDLQGRLKELTPEALNWLGSALRSLADRSASMLSSALNVIMVPMFTYYFLRDFDHITKWVHSHIPPRHQTAVASRATRVHTLVGAWLRGQFQVAAALVALYATGLWIVGLKLGFTIGVLAGLLSLVPFLGFFFGFGLALLMAIAYGGGALVLGVSVVFLTGQVLESYVLTPRWVGEKVGLPSVVTLIAVLLGSEAMGIVGILVAVPVAGVARLALIETIDWYRSSNYYTGQPEPED